MKRKLISLLSVYLFLFSFLAFHVFSASLSMTKIGALNTDGKTYPEWWYTGTNPTLVGTAGESSEVSLKLGDDTFTTTADGSGNWSYATALASGDHAIVLSQGSETYAFTLHLGQSFPGTSETTESTTGVPVTGFNQVVAITFGAGIALLATYFYIWGDSDKRVRFEKKFIKED